MIVKTLLSTKSNQMAYANFVNTYKQTHSTLVLYIQLNLKCSNATVFLHFIKIVLLVIFHTQNAN
jgi:hypothetical protein